MQAEGRVGLIAAASGSVNPLRTGTTGAVIVEATGKYREATQAGRVFAVANQGAVTTVDDFTLGYEGLTVYNPVGSGKNFAMLGFGWAQIVILDIAITSIGLMTGTGAAAATKEIVAKNRLSGGVASVANCDNSHTFTVAPVLGQIFSTIDMSANLDTFYAPANNWVDLEGSLIITPGYHVSVFHEKGNTSGFIHSFLWEEYTP